MSFFETIEVTEFLHGVPCGLCVSSSAYLVVRLLLKLERTDQSHLLLFEEAAGWFCLEKT